MTLEQLKERIEATCNKNGIFIKKLRVIIFCDGEIDCKFLYECEIIRFTMPSCDLLLEAVDLECRAIKARQSSVTNGIDE